MSNPKSKPGDKMVEQKELSSPSLSQKKKKNQNELLNNH